MDAHGTAYPVKLQFIDTNVLLYAYDVHAGERHQRARELVGRIGRERRGVLSIQILQEFYVNAVKKIAVPLDPDTARERIRALSRWPVHSPTPDDVLVATEVSEQQQLSFWDAMVLRSAEVMGCGVLWTEDLNAGQYVRGVEIANPFA